MRYVHGLHNSKIYRAWADMKQRCYNPKNSFYKDYGGRGIGVCDRWSEFNNFYKDMAESYDDHVRNYGIRKTTLDRVDTDGDYNISNVRWTTPQNQAVNRRINSNNSSGYKGVSRGRTSGTWRSYIHYNGIYTEIGSFKDKHKAAKIYNFWANDIFGEYARLNEIDGKKYTVVASG